MGPGSRALWTRKRLRAALGIGLLLALGAVGVQLVRTQWDHHLRRLRSRQIDFLPEVAQRIQNFRRVKMEGERKAWEVAAREAQYLEDDDQIVVGEPEMRLFLKGDQGVVALKGREGRILLDGREMDRVELTGGIELRFRDYLVTTDDAVYERATDAVVSPGAVTVEGDGISLSGERMTVEIGPQRMRLEGKVETVVRRREQGADAAPM